MPNHNYLSCREVCADREGDQPARPMNIQMNICLNHQSEVILEARRVVERERDIRKLITRRFILDMYVHTEWWGLGNELFSILFSVLLLWEYTMITIFKRYQQSSKFWLKDI